MMQVSIAASERHITIQNVQPDSIRYKQITRQTFVHNKYCVHVLFHISHDMFWL
jgi:hypothetical protein